jgi:hypothetical protein
MKRDLIQLEFCTHTGFSVEPVLLQFKRFLRPFSLLNSKFTTIEGFWVQFLLNGRKKI